jgi:hypothetical protein
VDGDIFFITLSEKRRGDRAAAADKQTKENRVKEKIGRKDKLQTRSFAPMCLRLNGGWVLKYD